MAEKMQMPMSGGGLMRFSDEVPSKFEIPPMAVIVAIIVVILVELYFYKFV